MTPELLNLIYDIAGPDADWAQGYSPAVAELAEAARLAQGRAPDQCVERPG